MEFCIFSFQAHVTGNSDPERPPLHHVTGNSDPERQPLHYNYLVRFINPEQKSKFVTKIWHNVSEKFSSVSALKLKLVETYEEKLPSFTDLECGYFEKRSNSKCWIEDNQDLQAMYRHFRDNDEITLWCEGCPSEDQHKKTKKTGKKRKAEDSEEKAEDGVKSKRAAKEDRIDATTQQLREKHGETYSGPQFRLWARMHLSGQHDSLDEPPHIPLFTGSTSTTKGSKRDSLTEALTSAATAVVGILSHKDCAESTTGKMSPAKRARVSGQYLDHLEKLKQLQESGVLTVEEFEEQKTITLKNIRQLNC